MLQQPVRIVFQARNNLTAVQTGRAIANFAGLQHLDRKAEPGSVQGRRQPQDAAADDDDIDASAGWTKRLERGGCPRPLPDRIGKP